MRSAENMAHDLETDGRCLQMTQTLAAELRVALSNFQERAAALAALRSEKAAARKWMNAAGEALTNWLGKARLAVMLARGVQWSEAWLEAGFTHRATSVPKAIGARIELAWRVLGFLARNPQLGVAHANVTASHGRKLYDDMVNARQVRRQLIVECNHARIARNTAERMLRHQMRQVMALLTTNVKPNDPCWQAFGLNQPRVRRSKRRRSTPTPPTPNHAVVAA
jgi:hypothetical protein